MNINKYDIFVIIKRKANAQFVLDHQSSSHVTWSTMSADYISQLDTLLMINFNLQSCSRCSDEINNLILAISTMIATNILCFETRVCINMGTLFSWNCFDIIQFSFYIIKNIYLDNKMVIPMTFSHFSTVL